jgi:hypothetical protein
MVLGNECKLVLRNPAAMSGLSWWTYPIAIAMTSTRSCNTAGSLAGRPLERCQAFFCTLAGRKSLKGGGGAKNHQIIYTRMRRNMPIQN